MKRAKIGILCSIFISVAVNDWSSKVAKMAKMRLKKRQMRQITQPALTQKIGQSYKSDIKIIKNILELNKANLQVIL